MSMAPRLIADLEHDDPGVRAWAAEKLGQDRVQEAVTALLPQLSDSEGRVRRAAFDALVEIGDPRVIPALCSALRRTEWRQEFSVYRVAEVFGAAAVPALIEEFQLGSTSADSGVAQTLIAIGDPAVRPLSELFGCGIWNVKQAILQVLGCTDRWDTVPALVRVLADENVDIRFAAAIILRELKDPRAAPALADALKDCRRSIRYVAAGALSKFGKVEQEEALLQVLRDPDESVRNQAVVALGRIGTERAILPLVASLQDEYLAAAIALRSLAKRAACPALRAALPILRKKLYRHYADQLSRETLTSVIECIEEATTPFRDLPVPALPYAGSENLPRVNDVDAAPGDFLNGDRLARSESSTGVMKWLRRIPIFRRKASKQ